MSYDNEDLTIERCPHDRENPYTMILNDLIRDNNISPNCRMILIWFLSHKDTNKIKVSHIYNNFKKYLGRDKVYKIIDEAIVAGYMCVHTYMVQGLKRYKYRISERPKYKEQNQSFKKCLPFPENQYTENQYTDFQGTNKIISNRNTNTNNKQESIKEKPPETRKIVHNSEPKEVSISPSATAAQASIPFHKEKIDFFSDDLIEILEMEPKYLNYFRPRIVSGWVKKYGSHFVLQTIKLFFEILKKQKTPIRNPEAWMESAFNKNYTKENQRCEENKKFAQNLKKTYNLSQLKINKRYCQDMNLGKDFYYNLDTETFKNSLQTLYETE